MRVTDARKVAVLRANGLGDLVFTLPALEALRAAYAGAEITLLGTARHAALLAGRPGPVDRVMALPPSRGVNETDGPERPEALDRFVAAMRAEGFDIALQLHGGGRYSNPLVRRFGARVTAGFRTADAAPLDRWVPYCPLQHDVVRHLEVVALVGATPVTLTPRLSVTARDRAEAASLVPGGDAPLVLLNPGATDPRRRWPAERFAAVADALAAGGMRIVLNGAAGERRLTAQVAGAMRAPAIDLAGRLSLGGLLALAARARVVISNDSGPLHLASAAGARTVGLYWCGNLLNKGILMRARHRALVSWRLECPVCGANCMRQGCNHAASFVADIAVDDVVAQAVELSGGAPAPGRAPAGYA